MELDARKRKILEAVIVDYISTAEPVGSRTISKKYELGVSPATVRNEMADLEELGLLEQPHTSAGRIPSDLGYRYYVDCLMRKVAIEDKLKDTIRESFGVKAKQIEDIIKHTSKTLSTMTNYTSLVIAPKAGSNSLQMIQLIFIEPGKALIVIITDGGRVENKFIEIPQSVTKEDLDIVSMCLNQKLKGLTLEDWDKNILKELQLNLIKQQKVYTKAIDLLDSILNTHTENKIYLGGALNILNQPEFMDVDKARSLLTLLEQEEELNKVMKNNLEEGVAVKIGTENDCEGIKDCSLITATYKLNGNVMGTIGVLGPTRMQYSHVVSIVDYLTQVLSRLILK
ncbi:heat-inducible transcription repressor HrcA [Desulfonispora thiosulfatigenes DSM 11270]|uniref:Heat-inducible transcription repressor HrcA n=1 Tax=Desulfonispora thiosulfatigenes DSM 11270 TaxID=656914 RepID=A0A1W1VC42_DESTI|nr:heat-inducible transcriptional repressor HrcA [Desulfonispora thiosulfatigenes]SMB90866.1 heat-inducible transcription repressor HrcA [Desulfonispora thiosulfatigenes DSM 11270]